MGRGEVGSYIVDYAASSRSTCKISDEKIQKGELRIGKYVQAQNFDGTYAQWMLFDVFEETANKVEEFRKNCSDTAAIQGFSSIRSADQKRIKKLLGDGKKKASAEGDSGGAETSLAGSARESVDAETEKWERALEQENDRLWKIKEQLMKHCKTSDLKEMLELNDQESSGGESKLIERCADGMLFGALPQCSTEGCEGGAVYYSQTAGVYKCTGSTAWARCSWTADPTEIERSEWLLPEDSHIPFLKRFKFVKHQKLHKPVAKSSSKQEPQTAESSAVAAAAAAATEPKVEQPVSEPAAPETTPTEAKEAKEAKNEASGEGFFSGVCFVFSGKLSMKQTDLIALVEKFGGLTGASVTKGTDFVISSHADLAANGTKIREAKKQKKPIVVERFLHRCIELNRLLSPDEAATENLYLLNGPTPKATKAATDTATASTSRRSAASRKRSRADSDEESAEEDEESSESDADVSEESDDDADLDDESDEESSDEDSDSDSDSDSYGSSRRRKAAAAAKKRTTTSRSRKEKGVDVSDETVNGRKGVSGKPRKRQRTEEEEGEGEHDSDSEAAKPTTRKLTIKGRAAVDPDSNKADETHVLEIGDAVYNVVLNKADVRTGSNSYYQLQILEHDSQSNCFYLFRKWGRVGTTIGDNKLEKFTRRDAAIREFEKLYLDKTGNHWSQRAHFEKQPRKMYPVDIDYGADLLSEPSKIDKLLASSDGAPAGKSSQLDPRVRDLVSLLFDVKAMQKMLLTMEIDVTKMPLGKLSRANINAGYSILSRIQDVLTAAARPADDAASSGSEARRRAQTQAQLEELSNQFYTRIPHDCGAASPPIIADESLIKAKSELLDSLLDMEIATSLLSSADGDDGAEDPMDSNYAKLNTKLEPIDHASEEFTMIAKYVRNTHGSTHDWYTLELEDVFRVERFGERERYAQRFAKLHNRMLLWHGSRLTNFVGILSQGLRIAPPEAPVTGYMFGKGIYFADMVSKSANYCRTSKEAPTGVMLLSEVALGDMYALRGAKYMDKPPNGKHSTFGMGRFAPDPEETHVAADGTIVPLGPGIDQSDIVGNTSLQYNEFIVYDVDQVNIKYLLKLRFNYHD